MRALELYIVDELLVAEEGLPAQFDTPYWEKLALEHKAARLHLIPTGTTEGRKFCRGYRVAGILSRPMDLTPSSCGSPSSLSFSLAAAAADESKGSSSAATGPEETRGVDSVRQRGLATTRTPQKLVSGVWPPSTARDAFFTWLERALRLEISDESSAEAYFHCVHVILAAGEEREEQSELAHEGLEGAAEILDLEAPNCAAELQVRWCAAHVAESDFERIAVAEVQASAPSVSTLFTEEQVSAPTTMPQQFLCDVVDMPAGSAPQAMNNFACIPIAGIIAMGVSQLVETRLLAHAAAYRPLSARAAATHPPWV